MPMDGDYITLTEAADRLGLDRSGVFRKAKRGDFGPIHEIGSGDKPTLILVSSAAVDAAIAARAAS